MALQNGDFVKIRYTGRIKESGEVFDTTSEEVAKKEGIYDEKATFKSQAIVIGASHVLKGLEEGIIGGEVGAEKTFDVPPEKAYGPRDPKMVKLVPAKEFKKQGMRPYPGMRIEAEGRVGKVQSVGGGRVRVDFNYELAGKALVYELSVEEKVNKTEEKIRHLLERNFQGVDPNDYEISLEGKKAVIVLPEQAKFSKEAPISKFMVQKDVFAYIDGLEEVEYREVFKNPVQATLVKPEKKAPAKKPAAKKKAPAKKAPAKKKAAAKKK